MFFQRFSLRTSIVISIIAMGCLGVVLALVIGSLYRQLSVENQVSHLQQITELRANDIIKELKFNSQKLGQTLQNDKEFRLAFTQRNTIKLEQLLESQFHQYFVTAGITKLENISVYDTGHQHISNYSSIKNKNQYFKENTCGDLITRSASRIGPSKLKVISELCKLDNKLMLSALIPIGGIFVKGYVEIITDLSFSLQKIEKYLNLPTRISGPNGNISYQSNHWPSLNKGIESTISINASNNSPGITITTNKDMSDVELRLEQTRNSALIIAFITTVIMTAIFLTILKKSTFTPLDKLGKELKNLLDNNQKLGHTLELNGNTEIRELTSRFNEMVLNLKDSYGKIELARDDAIEANMAKSQFLANMSHELRTPLNAVIGYSEMLQEDPRIIDKTDITQDITNIKDAARHLLKLINEVLDLSKIEAGKMELTLERFNIPQTIKDLCTTMQPIFKKEGNMLAIRCPRDTGDMYADITKLRQTLFNILNNACKFTHGGNILLNVDRHYEAGKEFICFEISDTGIGISEENLKKLFVAFNQVDQSSTRKFGGTGLGLAISQRFCKLMGGDITVSSKPGKGSVFRIKVPARVEQRKTEAVISIINNHSQTSSNHKKVAI